MRNRTDTSTVDAATRCAIEELVTEHAYRVDHGQADRLHELYAPDGQLRGLPTMDFESVEAIRAWGENRVRDTRTVVRHIQSNVRLYWDGDVLRGNIYYQMLRGDVDDTSRTAPLSMGEFDDEYVRDADGRWLLRERVISRLFFDPPGGSPA